ncbi:2-oxo acid dehydrogenase subunit E2 [Microbacterium sp. 5K110]|jgi:pyruvate dehydrogenase E2 component (dihydrolipoamide acetyltransferase)|uniref:2-oxo acid dehydrogenase subunit E2 n=1 Tax=unclassified Microbacterium TaxID=2609290 RepID=UPI0010FDA405|nr:2-oxo acid dehydrogenase subunit E2 [Microbacterium sp. 5K110]TLF33731.1 pyruvate dehydrogenase complex dihydrolipoamide acetyltransferase [Microbacterium sp. 5K110]
MAVVVRMPEIATGAAEAAIQSWLVEVGSPVKAGQAIVEIETEKAVVEYEAERAGVLAGILLPAGDAAAVGVPIAVLAEEGESLESALASAGGGSGAQEAAIAAAPEEAADAAAAVAGPAAAPADADAPAAAVTGPASAPADADAEQRLFASPLVRRLARERGVDLADVPGSGPRGRVVRRDLDAWTQARDERHPDAETPTVAPAPVAPAEAAPAPTAPVPAGAAYEDVPHTGMRRAIARRLTESKATVPHFYLQADCRVDALLELRARINEGREQRISVNDLVVKAVAGAMRDVPEANAIWTADATRRFANADIAVAVSVPGGLLTPVVRQADRLSIGELATTVRDLAERAREGRLKQNELEGGSFAVSNLGMYGTTSFSAIINPPHAGILAVGAATRRPVVDADGSLTAATVMSVTLSADHRVLDGALAAQWLAAFVARIENPLQILL